MTSTKIVPREFLLSFEDDGRFRSAQYIMKGQVFADDDTLLGQQDMPLLPYTDTADPAFQSVLGDVLSAVLVQNTALNAKIAELIQQLETKG